MADTLVLVAAGLLALPSHDVAAMRSLSTLAQYAGAPERGAHGIAAALLASLGVDTRTPPAPLAMLGAGGDPRDDYVLRADPVQLLADRDRIVLVQTIDDLSADDANRLVRMLDRHFDPDGLRFEAVRPNAWFARRAQAANVVTTPPDAARGRKLRESMPGGPDGDTWKRWQNEIEMMLHDHPINVAREARGALAISGIWFSGGGRISDVAPLPPLVVAAAPTRLGDLARGIAASAGTTSASNDDFEQLMARESGANRDVSRLAVLADARDLDARWLAPALERLAAQRLAALHLVADGNGTTATWTARAPRFWRRWVARASRRAFAIPAPSDE